MRRFVRLLQLISTLFFLDLTLASAQQTEVYRIDIHGTIENGLAPYVARGIRAANASGAAIPCFMRASPSGP